MASTVRVDFNHYAALAAALHKAEVEVVKTAAFYVEHRAKGNAPVDTGALRASIYTVTSESSGYAGAEAAASGANPHGQMQSEEPRPAKDTTAVVHAGMSYAPYVEYGARSAPAQPFLTPALADEQADFERALRSLWEHLS